MLKVVLVLKWYFNVFLICADRLQLEEFFTQQQLRASAVLASPLCLVASRRRATRHSGRASTAEARSCCCVKNDSSCNLEAQIKKTLT